MERLSGKIGYSSSKVLGSNTANSNIPFEDK